MRMSIVIVGGGFGGLEAAFTLRTLMGDAAAITLIDRQVEHSFLPSIHEICSGKTEVQSIQIRLATMLVPAGIRFVQAGVSAVDNANRKVVTTAGAFEYDCLLIATGAQNNFFGVPGAEQYSFRFRTAADAARIRERLMLLLADDSRTVQVVLAGGGTEGVEVAGELLDLIGEQNAAITMIEAQEQILSGFPAGVRSFAEDRLRSKGVDLITGERIVAVREASFTLSSGREVPQSMLIWSGGIKPSDLISELALPKDPAGWLLVDPFLRSQEDERIFAVGDAITVMRGGKSLELPKLAYHAQDQAKVAALNIASFLKGSTHLVPYKPRSRPRLISIGKDMGIFVNGDRFRTGAWVVGLKKAVERRHLMSSLSRPLVTGIERRIPGRGLLMRLGLKLPF
jgi:NADH dehydrogenase FAD-containing subunit